MNEELKIIFTYNDFCLNKNLEGVSHEESLNSSDAGENSINWIVGHLAVTRDSLHELLGIEKMCSDRITQIYKRGSEPFKRENAEDLKDLLKILTRSQKEIMRVFNEKDYKEEPEKSEGLAGLGFHEAYHIGQTAVMRRILGKPGVIK